MPKTATDPARDETTLDDPKEIIALERLRAKLARHNKEAEQLAEAMRQKPKND